MQNPISEALSARERSELVSLRRSQRRYRVAAVTAALTALIVLGLGARKPQKVQQADKYELVDADGTVRGEMGTWNDSPYLRLHGEAGGGVMVRTHGGAVSMSMFTDSPRHPRVHVAASEDGSEITLLDRNGHARARVALDSGGDLVEIVRPEQPRRSSSVRWSQRDVRGTGLEDVLDTVPRSTR
jgi:hypothetical protein